MKTTTRKMGLWIGLVGALAIPTAAWAAGTWGYEPENGPDKWGELGYALCDEGHEQSPIDIRYTRESYLGNLSSSFKDTPLSVTNNGHTIQVNYAPGSYTKIDGTYYELKQFHFHTPSEHTAKGYAYPMEVHFVHKDANGNLAVIGVFMQEGSKSSVIEKIWANMPDLGVTKDVAGAYVNANSLMPYDRSDYVRYNGSLTTPPCSEGVKWFVQEKPIYLSAEQIDQFRERFHGHSNSRPVQPLYDRTVLEND